VQDCELDCALMTADAPKRSAEQPAAQAGQGFPRGFSRSGRLLKHSDFERVYKQGRRHFSPHMTVFYLRREEDPQPRPVLTELVRTKTASPNPGARVGFTVGRVLGGAVVRNRIKRRLREAVRLRRSALQSAVDVVINPKKSVLTVEFSEVLEEVGRALELIAKKMVGK
jgi:ribonuclease P protein component